MLLTLLTAQMAQSQANSRPHGRRKELVRTWGTCPRCDRSRWATNYDCTVKGKDRHVTNFCPYCRGFDMHLLSDWQHRYDTEMAFAISAYEADTRSEVAATELLGKIAFFHDKEILKRYGGTIQECLPNGMVPEITADTYALFGMGDAAIRVIEAAIGRGHGLQRKLMMLLLYNGRVYDTHDQVMEALDSHWPEAQEMAFLLVEGYQIQGRHKEARDVLKHLGRSVPGSSALSQFKQLLSLSRQYGLTNTPCGGRRLMCPIPEDVPMSPMHKLLIGVLLLGCVGILIFALLSEAMGW